MLKLEEGGKEFIGFNLLLAFSRAETRLQIKNFNFLRS
jgi:hypothetical protein